jgi:hypothetical protein
LEREYTAHQRAGLIAVLLAQGNELSVEDIMRLTGLKRTGALYLLDNLSLVLPLSYVERKWIFDKK